MLRVSFVYVGQAYPQQQQTSNVMVRGVLYDVCTAQCFTLEYITVCVLFQVVAYQPPVVAHHTVLGVKPPNYIALSLVNFFFCCWPLGIIGLIYSLKVYAIT